MPGGNAHLYCQWELFPKQLLAPTMLAGLAGIMDGHGGRLVALSRAAEEVTHRT